MSFHLTPFILESTYEYLRTLPPFNGWKLPEPDDVEFHVTRKIAIDCYGDCEMAGDEFKIRISTGRVTKLRPLILTMAHEMVHIRCYLIGDKSDHGGMFKRHAALVCRALNFDPGEF
jgi:hypothetical protein